MPFDRYLASRIVVARYRHFVRDQRHFCVHNNVLVFGKVNNNVGTFDIAVSIPERMLQNIFVIFT